MNPADRHSPAHLSRMTCTDIEARLLSILATRPAPSVVVPSPSTAPCGRYDGDVSDLHALVDYLRSWDELSVLVDEYVATGQHEPYLTAIGHARLASGVSVVVAKQAVELLVARRSGVRG